VTINDDEPTISICRRRRGSPGSTAWTRGNFTLSRTGPTTNALSVTIIISGTATNGDDYDTISTTVMFLAGSATATVPVDDHR